MVVAAMAWAATWAVSEDPLAAVVMAVAVMAAAREAAKEEAVREVVTVAAAMEVVPDSATQHVPKQHKNENACGSQQAGGVFSICHGCSCLCVHAYCSRSYSECHNGWL